MNDLPASYWLSYLAPIVMLIGVLLLKRGRWPKRAGTAPHCPRCDYNLSGLEGKQCPECGLVLAGRKIVQGDRHRRPGLAWSGLTLILLGILMGVWLQMTSGKTLLEYLPTRLLIHNLRDPAIAKKTWQEIERRMALAQLSKSQHEKLAETALDLLPPSAHSPIAPQLLGYLEIQSRNNDLTQTQRKRYFDQLVLDLQGNDNVRAYMAWSAFQHRIATGASIPPETRQKLLDWANQPRDIATWPAPIPPELRDGLSRPSGAESSQP
jgi:hypothetical protein